ncbi:hypothetical protein CNBD1310 [Cryptococcus deneoformans B-3501A]|uniref:Expressed protein n=1 Tax=Cryptococcus deneoformans (strain JEC21 / ATCC MYA-565) TaxID=214684 RepID=Q5KHW8_CRYD1|nr:expressed protein [Cryptococcus neoformans var. neoformans JEC21]XP_776083.1 hypothetical protein CNBD1310 [Cryptococcus neoformans var. neoformans B-3501A]AAW43131.1 expressed protein [Cryptococcus neoformans var. neoformans JEC21]EAL21436.1 hypothetical protein CNBD1310 [Cryptococcus neoformans var. neoformans B-3501A]
MVHQDNPSNSILLLHPPALDPTHFVSRLISKDLSVVSDTEPVSWIIDNKYYSAEVFFQLIPIPQNLDGDDVLNKYHDVGVVVYLFEGPIPKVLPPRLVKFMSEPRDVAIAVRALSSGLPEEIQDGEGEEMTSVTELFDEIGMEFIDEVNPFTDEDDERPMMPLDIIRQTLQTHLWPGMSRKPLHTSSQMPASAPSSTTSSRAPSPEHAQFDVTFNPPVQDRKGDGEQGEGNSEKKRMGQFPDLQELVAQMYGADFAAVDSFDKFDQFSTGLESLSLAERGTYVSLDDMELSQDNDDHQNLEEWLDEDEERMESKSIEIEEKNGRTSREAEDQLHQDSDQFDPVFEPNLSNHEPQPPGFQDDFTDFQSAPPPPSSTGSATLALDPTPLLLHLQSVRAELAGVEDEDERRVRAGREVAHMLKTLGLEVGVDDDDLGLDDIGLDSI